MKRLRDIEPSSELQRQARRMVESVEPVSASPERMARIRRKLDEPRGALVALRRLPAIAIAGLIALFGASAFAAVRVFEEVRDANAVEAAQQAERARAAQSKRVQSADAPKALEAVAVEPELPPVLEADDIAAVQEQRQPESVSPRVAPRPRSKIVQARTPEEEQAEIVHDSALVHRAVKALRRDRDPELAARLLEEDRVRNPSGPLAEEALSLRIEAALALHDVRARALAEQYVARYPSGRYLAIARLALNQAALSEEAPK